MKNFLILALAVFGLLSCNKNDDNDMTVTLKTNGSLIVKVADSTNTPLKQLKVYLYDNSGETTIDSKKTDDNGNVDFGQLNQGSYEVYFDSCIVNNKKYKPYKDFQIISGEQKTVTINPQEHVGVLKLNCFKYSSYIDTVTSFSNLNIALASSDILYYHSNDIKYCINNAEYKFTSNYNGIASIQIPSNRAFYILVYNSDMSLSDSYGAIGVNKDGVYKLTLYVNTDYFTISTYYYYKK